MGNMKPAHVWAVIGALVLFIAGFDIYLYSDSIADNSITQVIIEATKHSPLVPYFIGFLSGFLAAHFFDTYTQK